MDGNKRTLLGEFINMEDGIAKAEEYIEKVKEKQILTKKRRIKLWLQRDE